MTSLTLTAQHLAILDHALTLSIEEYQGRLVKYFSDKDRALLVNTPTIPEWGELIALRDSLRAARVLTVEVNA